jgi:hypothetical protein
LLFDERTSRASTLEIESLGRHSVASDPNAADLFIAVQIEEHRTGGGWENVDEF